MPTVALIGSPNSGKTTLFNWLTGSKFKTVNYAGSTCRFTVRLCRFWIRRGFIPCARTVVTRK